MNPSACIAGQWSLRTTAALPYSSGSAECGTPVATIELAGMNERQSGPYTSTGIPARIGSTIEGRAMPRAVPTNTMLVVRGPGEGWKIRASVHWSSGDTAILVVAVVRAAHASDAANTR